MYDVDLYVVALLGESSLVNKYFHQIPLVKTFEIVPLLCNHINTHFEDSAKMLDELEEEEAVCRNLKMIIDLHFTKL